MTDEAPALELCGIDAPVEQPIPRVSSAISMNLSTSASMIARWRNQV